MRRQWLSVYLDSRERERERIYGFSVCEGVCNMYIRYLDFVERENLSVLVRERESVCVCVSDVTSIHKIL